METDYPKEKMNKDIMFKSYYVVWKPKELKNIHENIFFV